MTSKGFEFSAAEKRASLGIPEEKPGQAAGKWEVSAATQLALDAYAKFLTAHKAAEQAQKEVWRTKDNVPADEKTAYGALCTLMDDGVWGPR